MCIRDRYIVGLVHVYYIYSGGEGRLVYVAGLVAGLWLWEVEVKAKSLITNGPFLSPTYLLWHTLPSGAWLSRFSADQSWSLAQSVRQALGGACATGATGPLPGSCLENGFPSPLVLCNKTPSPRSHRLAKANVMPCINSLCFYMY